MAFVDFQEFPPHSPSDVRRIPVRRLAARAVAPHKPSRRHALLPAILAIAALFVFVSYPLGDALDSPLMGMVVANLMFVVPASLWSSIRKRRRARPR